MQGRKISDSGSAYFGDRLELAIQATIAASIVCFTLETLPNLSGDTRRLLRFFEVIFVLLFTVEYLARIYFSERRLGYVFSFYGLVDLIAIIPFYLSAGLSLQALRAFRFLRLFHALKLTRYSKATERLYKAFTDVKSELIAFSIMACIVIYVAAVGIYFFENPAQPEIFKSVLHSLWWAVSTLTTVGYGDVYPITTAGKMFTFIILLIGLGIVSIPAALIASALSKQD